MTANLHFDGTPINLFARSRPRDDTGRDTLRITAKTTEASASVVAGAEMEATEMEATDQGGLEVVTRQLYRGPNRNREGTSRLVRWDVQSLMSGAETVL